MNLNAVAERVMDEEPFPRSRASIICLYARRVQPGSQFIRICTLDAEVPLRIRSKSLRLY